MSKARFNNWREVLEWAKSFEGFLTWLEQPGNILELPFGSGSRDWTVEITDKGFAITSRYYRVEAQPPYGAPKIVAYLVDFGGHRASGVVQFGFDPTGKLVVSNRKRLTPSDEFDEGLAVVAISNGTAPDRMDDPTAIVASLDDKERIAALTSEKRLALLMSVRDGVEMNAARELFRWADSSGE